MLLMNSMAVQHVILYSYSGAKRYCIGCGAGSWTALGVLTIVAEGHDRWMLDVYLLGI